MASRARPEQGDAWQVFAQSVSHSGKVGWALGGEQRGAEGICLRQLFLLLSLSEGSSRGMILVFPGPAQTAAGKGFGPLTRGDLANFSQSNQQTCVWHLITVSVL